MSRWGNHPSSARTERGLPVLGSGDPWRTQRVSGLPFSKRRVRRIEADRKEVAEALTDPVRFCRKLLAFDPWPKQEAILSAIDQPRARVAVKACHSSGKTAVAARAALFHLMRYDDGIVLTTAPTWPQVERLLWGEIHLAVQDMRVALPSPVLSTEIKLAPNNYAVGIATNQGVRFQGYHGGHILVIIDEAPGVLGEILEAIEGIRASGDVRLLELGNPVIASGPFYEAFTTARTSWHTMTISAFDTPNLIGLTLEDIVNREEGDPFLDDGAPELRWNSALTSRRWVWEKYHEWGPTHPSWESRVLGNFPTQSEDALLSLTWLEQARHRPVVASVEPFVAGLDVAGPGESETVLCLRKGPGIHLLQAWLQQDPRGALVAALAPYRGQVTVNVDSAGIGYYLGKHVQDQGFLVNFVNVGERPHSPEHYANLKAELYWGLRQRFEAGDVAGLTDDTAIAQLSGIRYDHTARGQVQIESKEQARKRGVPSPDRAEAIMLAFRTPGRAFTPAAGPRPALMATPR